MLIARDVELELVRDLLREWPVVTLTGPGGVGKTTLARHVALGRSGDGATQVVELAPLGSRDFADAVAGSLGFVTPAELIDALARHDGTLLVLDNCEHVLTAAARFVADVVAAAPAARILATSREPLDVADERVVSLEPLSTEGSPSPAAQMFVEAVAMRGVPPPRNDEAIATLCRSLDGLPLALELAASRVAGMTIDEMVEHLDVRLDLLSRARPQRADRHHSLRAAIAWSYDLLAEPDRDLFAALGVFAGPFTLDMAAAVVGGEGDDELDVRDGLQRLIEASLLVHEPAAGTSWYRMLETIRIFAREQLERTDRLDELRLRFVDHVTDVCTALYDPAFREWAAHVPVTVHRMFRSIRLCIDWCLANENSPDRCHTLIAPLWWLEDTGHQAEAADVIDRVLEHWPGAWDDTRTLTGAVLATLLRMVDRREAAIAVAGKLVEEGSGIGLVYAMRVQGMEARAEGKFAESTTFLAEGADLARSFGYEAIALELDVHTAMALARLDRMDDALSLIAHVSAASAPYPQLQVQSKLFEAYFELDHDTTRADHLHREILEIARQDGYRWAEGRALEGLGLSAILRGDIGTAAARLAESAGVFSAIPARGELCMTLTFASALLASTGDVDLARRTLVTAERFFGDPVFGPFEIRLLDRLGAVDTPAPEGDGAEVAEVIAALRSVADDAEQPRDETATGKPSANRLERDGDVYLLAFGGATAQVKATKGLDDLARLLSVPHREIAAIDLMGGAVVASSTGEVLDTNARSAYERRIRELQSDLDEAEANHDDARTERARAEMDALVDQLTAAYGLGGRSRMSGDAAEKARSAVTWRIRAAIDRVAAVHPGLGDHLSRSIRTGRFCVYDPSRPRSWTV
jgi:predicted ATPase